MWEHKNVTQKSAFNTLFSYWTIAIYAYCTRTYNLCTTMPCRSVVGHQLPSWPGWQLSWCRSRMRLTISNRCLSPGMRRLHHNQWSEVSWSRLNKRLPRQPAKRVQFQVMKIALFLMNHQRVILPHAQKTCMPKMWPNLTNWAWSCQSNFRVTGPSKIAGCRQRKSIEIVSEYHAIVTFLCHSTTFVLESKLKRIRPLTYVACLGYIKVCSQMQ